MRIKKLVEFAEASQVVVRSDVIPLDHCDCNTFPYFHIHQVWDDYKLKAIEIITLMVLTNLPQFTGKQPQAEWNDNLNYMTKIIASILSSFLHG